MRSAEHVGQEPRTTECRLSHCQGRQFLSPGGPFGGSDGCPSKGASAAMRSAERLGLGRRYLDHAADRAALQRNDVDDQGGAFAAGVVVLLDLGGEVEDALA